MPRFKDQNYNFHPSNTGGMQTWEQAQAALLMDLRDELKAMNAILHCANFLQIPHTLNSILREQKKRRKPKPKVVAKGTR